MLARTISCRFDGLDTDVVKVEANVLNGFPQFSIVGLAGTSILESRERIRAAIQQMGEKLPLGRIVVNLYPGDVKKGGTQWDLPIAVALLAAGGRFPSESIETCAFLGELTLDGRCRSVPGIYTMVDELARQKVSTVYLPYAAVRACAGIQGIRLKPCHRLLDVVHDLDGTHPIHPQDPPALFMSAMPFVGDFQDMKRAALIKRLLTIAVAGRHSVLLIGPPGIGKSMALRLLPSILPPLTTDELRTVRRIYSSVDEPIPTTACPPVRMPHDRTPPRALLGGGVPPRPGEITLAHHGVLCMDEIAQFDRRALDGLRLPMERHEIELARGHRRTIAPADFQLVATANPCPCGYDGDPQHTCHCSPSKIERYRQHLPAPLIDRFDLVVRLSDQEMKEKESMSSQTMRESIIAARQLQRSRNAGGCCNARLSDDVTASLQLSAGVAEALRTVSFMLGLSLRSERRTLLVARTIADLAREKEISKEAVYEAAQYHRGGQEWLGQDEYHR